MSLKQKLIDTLQANGRIDLNELQVLCNDYPSKTSTAEKRLREFREPLHKDYRPEVGVEKKDGYINAYVWQEVSYVGTPFVQPMTSVAQEFLNKWVKPKEVKETAKLF